MGYPREFVIPPALRRRPIWNFAAALASAISLILIGVVWPSSLALSGGLVSILFALVGYKILQWSRIRFNLDEQRLVVAYPDPLLRRGPRQRLEIYELSDAGLAFEKGMYSVWSSDATQAVTIPLSLDGYNDLLKALQSRLQVVEPGERKMARLDIELKKGMEFRYGIRFGRMIGIALCLPISIAVGELIFGEGYHEAINSAIAPLVVLGGIAFCAYLFYALGPRFRITDRGIARRLFRRTVQIPFERVVRCSFKRRWGVNVLAVESDSQSFSILDLMGHFLPLVRTLRVLCPDAWPVPSFPYTIALSTLHPVTVFMQYLLTGVGGFVLGLLISRFGSIPTAQGLAVSFTLVWSSTTAYLARRWQYAPRQVILNEKAITAISRRETRIHSVSDLERIEFEHVPTDQKIVLRFSNNSGKLVFKSDYLAVSALELRDTLHLLYPEIPWEWDIQFDADPLTTPRDPVSA